MNVRRPKGHITIKFRAHCTFPAFTRSDYVSWTQISQAKSYECHRPVGNGLDKIVLIDDVYVSRAILRGREQNYMDILLLYSFVRVISATLPICNKTMFVKG